MGVTLLKKKKLLF